MFGEIGPQFVPEDDSGRPLPRDAWPQRRAANGETFYLEFVLTQDTGDRRRFEANGRPVDHDGHESGVVVIRDITERSLFRFQDEFLAMASHELRTPLTALFGYLQMHQRRLLGGASVESVLPSAAIAIRQVERLRVLVDDLVDAERLRTGRLTLRRERTNLVELLEQAITVAEPLVAGTVIRLTLPDEPVLVDADPVRLEQVLLNLISNAHEHAPDTTSIDVSLRAVDGSAKIEVRDYGPGIPAGELGQLFSRFYQVTSLERRSKNGLGLGLYIAREIVTEHGGTITVESEPGAGARFVVRLPLLRTVEAPT
jgi:two-component system CheB/CheR fusion protein